MPKKPRHTLDENELPPQDLLDIEIDAAVREERKIDLQKMASPPMPATLSTSPRNPTKQEIDEWTADTLHLLYRVNKEDLQLRAVQRLTLRRFPMTKIAHALDISERQGYRILTKLKNKSKSEINEITIEEIVGRYIWDFECWIADTLRIFDKLGSKGNIREQLNSMRVVVQLANHRISLLDKTGYLKSIKFPLPVRQSISTNPLFESHETPEILDFVFGYIMDNYKKSPLEVMKAYRDYEKARNESEKQSSSDSQRTDPNFSDVDGDNG